MPEASRARRRPRARILALVVAVAVVLSLGAAWTLAPRPTLEGRVVDLDGRPVAGARVSFGPHEALARSDGRFTVADAPDGGWVRADAAGFLPRLRPARAGVDVLLRLTPDDGQTISIVFGGDVMFGRRFFDPEQTGATNGLLAPDASAADQAALLAGVRPAIEAADLAIVNLETPLVASPQVDPTGPRPTSFHPTKEFVFASSPAAAAGLAVVGVDAVGIGNNHLFDALEPGVDQTLAALDTAGFAAGAGRAGGGRTQAEAWAPAMMTARGSTVALIACTTIDGHLETPTYVAEGDAKGGAAACSDDEITTSVKAARRTAELVIVMIHGGYEYDRSPTPNIAHISAVARDAGAALVVDHHPHVVGGFDRAGDNLTAWTIGNLLFDQLVWPTFESYLLTVHVRNGQVVRAFTDSLMIDRFRPVGLVGDLAAHVARDAAGWAPGPFVVEDGTVEITDPARILRTRLKVDLVGTEAGTIVRLPGSMTVDPTTTSGAIEVGRDLLWTGDFEAELAARRGAGAPLWDLPSHDASLTAAAARAGAMGIRMRRTGASKGDAVLQPVHRIPVASGTNLTFVASIRADAGAEALVDLRWYNDLAGASQARTTLSLGQAGTDGWREVRIDLVVPPNAAAVSPQIRLAAPTAGATNIDIDDLRLIEWAPLSEATLATDHLRVRGAAALHLLVSYLAGGDGTLGTPIVREVAWRSLEADVPALPAPAAPPGDAEGGD